MEQKRENGNTRKYRMHMLHLAKLSRLETEDSRYENKDNSNERDEKSFFCYGYYDRMTYIADNEANPFTYEHAFSIKYPYKKPGHPVMADQLFTLLEPAKENDGRGNDPFMAADESVPFLGVFLITISLLKKDQNEDFSTVSDFWRNELNNMLNDICSDNDIFRIYDSPNCADLCLVIRTGKLDKIYEIERKFENREGSVDNSDRQGLRYTLYIASLEEDVLGKSDSYTENEEQKIEIRFQCDEDNREALKSCLESMAKAGQAQKSNEGAYIEVGRVNGKGDYALKIGYSLYAKIYPYYLKSKLGIDIKADIINENEEWRKVLPGLLNKCTFAYERWYMCIPTAKGQNNNQGNNQNSRKDYDKDSQTWEDDRKIICYKMHQAVDALKEYGNYLESGKNDFMPLSYSNSMICAKRRFEEQCCMIKDLLYTYENLWFDKSTIPEGRIFYAQISVLIEGICRQLDIIRAARNEMERAKGAIGRWSERNLQVMMDDLIENMYIMISGINNFNRLIQAVNQNLRNVPNYEMHSKVNVEKYLYAYTMYLMDICNRYYQNEIEKHKDKKNSIPPERIFPIVIIGMSHGKISAQTLFRGLDNTESNKDRQSVFLVQCPNYHRFANIYHVLPMITHEISHCFRYVDREKRNKFLIGYLVRTMVENMTDYLTEEAYWKDNLYTWEGAVNFLYEIIADKMQKNIEEALEKELPYTHLSNMRAVCLDKIWKCLDAEDIYYTSGRKLWGICRDNFVELYTLCGIKYVTPEDMMSRPEEYVLDALPNLLLDILRMDDDRIRGWESWSRKTNVQEFTSAWGQWIGGLMRGIIDRYKDGKAVIYDDIYYVLQLFTKKMWRKFLEEDSGVYQKIKRGECGEAVTYMNKLDKLILDKDYLVFGESPELEGYIEKLKITLNWNNDDALSLKRRIREICLLAKEIFQAWTVYGKESVCAPVETENIFIKEVHKELYDKYHEKCENREKNPWIIAKDVQRMYVSLGIVNSSPEQFISRVKTALCKLDRSQIEAVLNDKMKLYGEVFADLGMCKVFNFNDCGYFTYTIHLFMKEREMAVRDAYDMSAERMKLVIYVLWLSSQQGDMEAENLVKQKYKEFKKWVSNYKTEVEKYEKKFTEEKKKEITMDRSELSMHRRMIAWMDELDNDMELPVWNEKYREFLVYAESVYRNEMRFLERNDDFIISNIGGHYNNFTDIGNGMSANGQNIMDVQNQFVLAYYGKMQDISTNIDAKKIESERGAGFAKLYNRMLWSGWEKDK